jgi:guanine deaminase
MNQMNPKTKTEAKLKGVRGRILHAMSPSEIVDLADGVLVFDVDGKIVYCEPFQHFSSRGENIPLENLSGKLIIPGLVDCHLHLPQLDQRGRFGYTLLNWLKNYILPSEKAFSDLKVVNDVGRRFFKKLILNGTTTASIYNTIHEEATSHAFELAEISGVRAIIGKVMMDQNSPDGLVENTSASIEASMRLYRKWHGKNGGKLKYALTPRFAPTCSLALWKEIGMILGDTDIYVQSHIAETKMENDLVRKAFPQFKDYFELFEKTGVVGSKVLLAHAIHLTDSEYSRMANSDTKIAHCPTSNFFLKSGSMPMSRILKAGVTLGLGTDIGAGISMSLFSEMRHSDYAQLDMSVSPVYALYLATLGGAKTLSMDNEIGNFESGKYADFCMLDIKKIDFYYELSEMDTLDLLSLIMYRGGSGVVEAAYVAGKKLDVDNLNTL